MKFEPTPRPAFGQVLMVLLVVVLLLVLSLAAPPPREPGSAAAAPALKYSPLFVGQSHGVLRWSLTTWHAALGVTISMQLNFEQFGS